VVSQALQTVRGLTPGDTRLLADWAQRLDEEPRATRVAEEVRLEAAYGRGEREVQAVLTTTHAGPSATTRQQLLRGFARNRELAAELRERYLGRCQLCAFDPSAVYGAGVCEGHHIQYLSRGGEDHLQNLVLLCPNHHAVVHATEAAFDFADLRYVFPNNRREPLALNTHLRNSA
jgi:predicted HNH restriction endonuclease